MLKRDADLDLNGLVDPLKPGLDPIATLEQLIRVQSQRIRVGVEFEKKTEIVNQHLHRDMRTQRENLETLAALKGMTPTAGRPSGEGQNTATNNMAAQEAMRNADKSEMAQEKLVGAMGGLMDLIRKKQARETIQE
jgi:hypothetical protein